MSEFETIDPELQAAYDELDAELEAQDKTEEESTSQEEKAPSEPEEGQAEASEEEPTEAAAPDPQEETAEDESAPEREEKILGKFTSQEELVKSYQELERWAHQLSSEKTALERQQQETKQKLEKPEPSIDEEFDKRWEEDPQAAVKFAMQAERERERQRAEQESLQREMASRAEEAQSFVQSQAKENSDFRELLPFMSEVLPKYEKIINPLYANSKETTEALYYLARGMNIERYEKAAVEKAKLKNEAIKAEKRKAKSESSHSEANSDSPEYIDDMDKFMELLEKGDQAKIEEDLKRMKKSLS